MKPCTSEGQSSVFINTRPSPDLFLTVSVRCPAAPRASEDAEKPDQHSEGHTETRQVSPWCWGQVPGQWGRVRADRGSLHLGRSDFTTRSVLVESAPFLEESLLAPLYAFKETNKKRVPEGGKSESCRYLNKPVERRDIGSWNMKSSFVSYVYHLHLFCTSVPSRQGAQRARPGSAASSPSSSLIPRPRAGPDCVSFKPVPPFAELIGSRGRRLG